MAVAQPVGSQLSKKKGGGGGERTFLEHCQRCLGARQRTSNPQSTCERSECSGSQWFHLYSFMYNNACFKPSKTGISWIPIPLLHHDGKGVLAWHLSTSGLSHLSKVKVKKVLIMFFFFAQSHIEMWVGSSDLNYPDQCHPSVFFFLLSISISILWSQWNTWQVIGLGRVLSELCPLH